MTTTTNNISSNSFRSGSSKPSIPQKACNICERLLYSFEEILVCRVCHVSCHWRCVEPKTISQYGGNSNFICEKCNDESTSSSSHQITNGSSKINTDDRDFPDVLTTTNSTETNVANNIRYFEEKQQQSQIQRPKKLSDIDRYLPSDINESTYHHQNGQEKNDNRIPQRTQQQQNLIESDNDNETSTMFQANYQYTPLKEYAATRSNRTTSDNNLNGHQNSPADRQITSRYGGGLHYTNHGYDPTISRLVEAPVGISNIDDVSIHNRQHNFITTTNLSIPEKSSRRLQQSNSPVHSTSHLSQIRDNGSPKMKSSFTQYQSDHHSTMDSDSGVITMNSNSHQSYESPSVERKLTNFVEKLGKQLETDAQKLNEKLELKLKNLETMIHQQTLVIQRQDEVIERLKSQILQIETEREQDETKTSTSNANDRFHKQENINQQKNQIDRQISKSSTTITDTSKSSTKKAPAPRVEYQWLPPTDQNKAAITKLVKNVPANRERFASDSSSVPSTVGKLASSIPLTEPVAASSRLDNIIHQSDTKDTKNSSSSNYSLAQVRHQDRQQSIEPISMTQQQIVTSVHHDENNDDNAKNVVKKNRSSSSSSSSSSSLGSANQLAKRLTPTTEANRNSNIHRSYDLLPPLYQNDQAQLASKTSSLEYGLRTTQSDDLGSIYITPVEANQPAIQSNSIVKGYLRKQNRDSFLKRIERYYCILANDALLMHRRAEDRTPVKAINLKGAKVLYYDDPKQGPSLQLTWSSLSNDPKHYHLYAPNPQEAEQWVTGIQTTIHNLENKNNWQQYHLNI